MSTHLGPYRLLEPIAEGGQGAVWRAVDPNGQPVAVKTLHQTDHEGLKRFRQEAAVLANLTHPNLPRVFAQGTTNRTAWLAFELIEGESLFARVQRDGPQPVPWTARTVAAVADALEHCHQRGLVHRDVKPTNVVIERGTERPVLVDFGLVKRDPAQMRLPLDDQTLFSLSGSIKGTPEFMAPEQIDAAFGEVGPATDVHALGALLYGLLTASLPFGVSTDLGVYGVMHRVLHDPPPDPLRFRPDLDPALAEFCLGSMAKSPGDRPLSASSFKRDLLLLAGLPTSTESTTTAQAPELRSSMKPAVAAVALAAIVIAGLAWSGTGGPSAAPTPSATPLPPPSEAPAAAAPWGQPPAGWSIAWSLGAGDPPRLEPKTAWHDAAGQQVDPLRPVRAATTGAPVSGFNGEATALGDERVRLRYDLRRATLAYQRPQNLFLLGDAASGRSGGGRQPVRLRVPNDVESLRLTVGRALWERPELSLTYRLVTKIDRERVLIGYGDGAELADLNLVHRSGTLAARIRLASGLKNRLVRIPPARGQPHTVRFTPFASEPRRRVRYDQQPLPVLGPLFDRPPRAGRVQFEVSEVDVEISALTVEGRPTSTDVPARAIVDPPSSSSVRLAALFERLAPGPGGPCLGLGTYRLELDRDQLRLTSAIHGVIATARLPQTPTAGWLSLTREGDHVRAVAAVEGDRVELAHIDPLPAGGPSVHYGSSGPLLRFNAVEVWRGPDDPERRAFDRLVDPATADPPTTPTQRWRLSSLSLATVTDPAHAHPRLLGPRQAARRAQLAERAAGELLAVADRLPAAQLRDAITRALLGYLASGRGDRAEATARRLVERAGLASARATVQGFQVWGGRQRLVDYLVSGWVTIRASPQRAAGHRVAALLAPDRKSEAIFGLSQCLGNGQDPRTQTGRAALREALRLAERAHQLGHPHPQRALARRAELHTQLGEYARALELWDRSITEHVEWWAARQRSLCLEALGRHDEALVSAVIGYAAERHPVLIAVLRRLAQHPGAAGIRAVAWHLLNDRAAAVAAIQRAQSESPRQRDLAAYVSHALDRPVALPSGSRPSAVLVRARAKRAEALRALPQARKDMLVNALVLIDPAFAGHR